MGFKRPMGMSSYFLGFGEEAMRFRHNHWTVVLDGNAKRDVHIQISDAFRLPYSSFHGQSLQIPSTLVIACGRADATPAAGLTIHSKSSN